jgi:hypothetical protein
MSFEYVWTIYWDEENIRILIFILYIVFTCGKIHM